MSVDVRIPSQLLSYTGGARMVSASGATLGEVVADLDAQFPGLRFRIVDEQDRVRPHIKLFVGQEMANDLETPVTEAAAVTIIGALSGG